MAVIEIAKIQIRRGQETVTGTPTLDSGEFGWAVDTQNLYIGNGTLEEGAPQEGVTRLLTENDLNLFNLSTGTSYVYLKDDEGIHRANGITLFTDPSGNDFTYRRIIDKLNDFTTIYDFDGIGDGVTDNTLALQNAIDQIWLNSDKGTTRGRVVLRIPAGTYIVNGTIYLPPYCTLVGDGREKTVIKLMTNNRTLMQTCDPTSTPGNYIVFTEGGSSVTDNTSNIFLMGITFEWNPAFGGNGIASVQSTLPMVRIDFALDSRIIECQFNGYYPVGNPLITNASPDYTALEIRGQGTITTKDLIVQNCVFDGFYYGIYSNYDIQDAVISQNTFRNLGRGIVGAQQLGIGNQVGPTRTKIHNNKFLNIEQEAIYFFSNPSNIPANNTSMNNSFVEVGNGVLGDLNAISPTPVVQFQSFGNVSIGDYFDRLVNLNNAPYGYDFNPLVEGVMYIDSVGVVKKSIQSGLNELARFPILPDTQSIDVTYSIRKAANDISRKGSLLINASYVGLDSLATVTDNYTYTGSNNGQIEFSVITNTATNTLSLMYTNSGLASGDIKYKFSQLQ